MSDNFLQSFLKTGLFDIGDSDDRLTKLEKSIAELQTKFTKDYSLLPKYSLVAIDPNISDEEPILDETEIIVTTHWKALRTKYSEMPRNLLRGVILNALNNVGSTDPIAARIIYLTALNFFPYAKLNVEKDLVKAMLHGLGDLAEENAIEEWSFIENEPSLKLAPLKLNNIKFGEATLSAQLLQPKLKVAIGNDENSHGSNHGGTSSWGDHFAKNASESIASAFNGAIKNFSETLKPDSIETPINKFFTNFKKSLNSNLKTAFSSLTAVERRSKLLWWKETLYSQSQKKSYREIDNSLLPIIMAMDLNSQIPNISPISVDYLLKDTLYLLLDKKDKAIKFGDFFNAISKEPLKATLQPYFTELNEENGRLSITDFIALLVNNRLDSKDFQERTGIKDKEDISQCELAVTILHDLLTQRVIKE